VRDNDSTQRRLDEIKRARESKKCLIIAIMKEGFIINQSDFPLSTTSASSNNEPMSSRSRTNMEVFLARIKWTRASLDCGM
jgi:hypothetical protein